jgi:hypothetical protein
MTRRITTLVAGLTLLVGASGLAQEDPQAAAKTQARTSAKAWLALLSDHEYEKTWEQAGAQLKAAVSQEEWARKLSVTLGPMGKVESRAVRSTEYSTTMPGAPDGEYVVVTFDTTFQNKQTAVETVPLTKEEDGIWRVSGYWIR